MKITETLVIYLMLGAVVGRAMPSESRLPGYQRWARGVSYVLFWPFFASSLLGKRMPSGGLGDEIHRGQRSRLHHAKARLLDAIGSLTGLSQSIIEPQVAQLETVMASLDIASDRLLEMDDMLKTPEFDGQRVESALSELGTRGVLENDPRVASLKARQKNIERLQAMRGNTGDELERALYTLEEISSQVLLLRFADNPELKLERLLKDVTDSFGDLSSLVLELSEI
jgi:hypothetical protein